MRRQTYANYLLMTSCKGISSIGHAGGLSVAQASAKGMAQSVHPVCRSMAEALQCTVEADAVCIEDKKKTNTLERTSARVVMALASRQLLGCGSKEGTSLPRWSMTPPTAPPQGDTHKHHIALASITCMDDNTSCFGNCNHRHTINHFTKYVNGMAYTNQIDPAWAIWDSGFHVTDEARKIAGHMPESSLAGMNEVNCELNAPDHSGGLFCNMTGKALACKELVVRELE